ncbi:MAG: divergent polysaccharide deacetylase family protein [Alphaproteobacteria bacterium]|nr:divergent polysaccharide deacetylase family protein [Alphaproteobacteria bacterium]
MNTGSDLDKPLGQHRRSGKSGRRNGLSSGQWTIVAVFVAIFAGAGVFAVQQTALRGSENTATAAKTQSAGSTDSTEISPQADTAGSNDVAARQPGNSGANIQRTLTNSGNVVTTISPRDRGGDGPLILSGATPVGQDARVAHLPIPELLEKTDHGRLPVISADGRRAMDAYARPWSGARGTRLAIVVGGLGLSQTGTQYAIDTLPEEITLAFAASGNSLQRWLQEARRAGHEVLLQVPFEPFDYPQNDPGPHTLVVDDGKQQNLADLHWAMARITNYTGIMNFMGGRFLSNAAATENLMRDLAKRGVLFLDDGTSAQTVTGAVASAIGVPYAEGDMVIDNERNRGEIMKRLDETERVARRNGQAIAIASAFDVSVDAVAAWANEARSRGIEIVSVSALAEDPRKD